MDNSNPKAELINTIEIEPLSFAKKEYTSPNISIKQTPKMWSEYWYESVADSGIKAMKPIELGSWLVDIESINNFELQIIIEKELEEIELDNFEDQVSQICGGISIRVNNEIKITPTCCGDLGNLNEWIEIQDVVEDGWNQLWIGHPWIFYRVTDNKVSFSDYYEANLEEIEELNVNITIDRRTLIEQINYIRDRQIAFEERIFNVLSKMEIPNARKISVLLTGN